MVKDHECSLKIELKSNPFNFFVSILQVPISILDTHLGIYSAFNISKTDFI